MFPMTEESSRRAVVSFLSLIKDKEDALALITEDQCSLTYGEIGSAIESIIADLSAYGIKRHMRVGIIANNGTANSLLMLAVIETAICCPLSPNLTRSELTEQLSALDADLIICSDTCLDRVEIVCDELQLPLISFRSREELWCLDFLVKTNQRGVFCKSDNSRSLEKLNLDYSLILLTSGSTGKPKRVGLTLDNLMYSALEVAESLELNDSDICLSMWEQYHIGGVVDLLLAPLSAGSTILMTTGFSSKNLIAAIKSVQFTWLQCVPTTLLEILHVIKNDNITFPASLRLIRSVASNLTPAVQMEAEQLFGVPVLQTYGMTEASPLITSNLLQKESRKIGTVGKPLSTEIKIIRKGVPVYKAGEVGEILIRGRNVISNYDDPTGETSSCFKDGWFITGDLGYFDDEGFLCLDGREKQQINRGGEKISPKELETCSTIHDAVDDAIAVAIPHPTLGFVPGLIVSSRKKITKVMQSSLQDHLRKSLSAFKQPVSIWWVERLPKTVTGKILHSELELLLEGLQSRQTEPDSFSTINKSATLKSSFIERTLQEIWAYELALNQVGLNEDFVSLGGDSLSSVRVLMAAEKKFGIHYPSDRWPELTTIATMATCTEELLRLTLAQHNRSLGDQEQPSTAIIRENDSKSEIEFTISTGISGEICVDDLIDEDLAAYLIGHESVVQAKAAIERKRNLWTPQELIEFTDVYNKCSSSVESKSGEVKEKIFSYLNRVRDGLISAESPVWSSRQVCKGVRFYSVRRDVSSNEICPSDSSSKTLLVGFGGYFNRMMMPMDVWLSNLDGSRFDFLFVWDESRRFYNSGIDGLGSIPEAMLKQLNDVVESLGHAQVIGLGVSMGAYPCAAISRSLCWKGAAIICPDLGEKHPAYQRILRNSTHNSPILIYCGAGNNADVVAGKQLAKEHLTQLKLVKGCSGHNLLWFLYQRDALIPFLQKSVYALDDNLKNVD